ncbi:MAG: archease [Candidatus Omnitrophica bacterium]|nr:archease [Candidatus Omnitrophota bacterium]
MTKPFYELIDHTADIAIRVKSSNLRSLFIDTARAVFHIISPGGVTGECSPVPFELHLTSDTQEELLITWLNELISLSAAKEVIFTQFTIHTLNDTGLTAGAVACGLKHHRREVEIKAATYHDVRIRLVRGMWQAEVLFDV